MTVEKSEHGLSSGATGDAAIVRQVLRESTAATLATTDVATGTAYASLIQIATMPDATPIVLISGLARHTRNLTADSRASLLVDRRGQRGDIMTQSRATLIGRAHIVVNPCARTRFQRRHPTAASYADFADFAFWSLDIAVAHSIAGFGRIREIAGGDVRLAASPPDGAGQAAPVALTDAAEAMLLADCERELLRLGLQARGWRAAGVDAEGLDLAQSGVLHRFAIEPWARTTAELQARIRPIVIALVVGHGPL